MTLYCMWDGNRIPEERIKKRQNTCSKECKRALRGFYRKQAEEKQCRHCGKPSTPEERALFLRWRKTQPDYVAKKRGRPGKEI
jgi:methionyl-tRNA synthetase